MRIFFDTEFIEDGKTIDLISIGAVREDGYLFYAENAACDHSKAGDWVKANVLPNLRGGRSIIPRSDIADKFREFAGDKPEFWAHFAAYDWVALCQLFGTMMDLPKGWPMWCRDLKQELSNRGMADLVAQTTAEHNALSDAIYLKEIFESIGL